MDVSPSDVSWGHISIQITDVHNALRAVLMMMYCTNWVVYYVHYLLTYLLTYLWNTPSGRIGLAVTCLTAVWEDQGSNPTVGSAHRLGSCMFVVNITTVYSLGHGLCILTAVPRSTQPSTLRGMVKWVSAFELSNNKWQWWVWTGWTLAVALLRWQHHKHCHCYYYYYYLIALM